ncbi:MAG: hypothetical protein IK999_17830 [Ruminococcus sp.]|nr:hypothetical protein [Ruminococcus sp.]
MSRKIFSFITAAVLILGASSAAVGAPYITGMAVASAQENGLYDNNLVQPRTQDEIRAYIKDHPAMFMDHNFIEVDGKKYAQTKEVSKFSYYADKYDVEPVVEPGKYAIGKVSDESLQHALNALNIERYIAGLDEVALSDEYTNLCQTGSLVNAANGMISHTPSKPEGMDESMFNTGYTGTSKSNIAMASYSYSGSSSSYASSGYGTLTYAVIHQWMSDADSSNIDRLGHRRWCLNPAMKYTGFGCVGSTKKEQQGSFNMTTTQSFTSMYSFDNSFGARNTSYMVAWPGANMPVELFGKNEPWSFTTGRSFSSDTTVTLTRASDNKQWHFSYGSSDDGYFNVDNQGFGQGGCVCFRPSDIDAYNDGDVFTVQIKDGSFTKNYQVNFFAYHHYTSKIVKKATCTEYGVEKLTCSDCGESFEYRIPKVPHTMKETVIPPTCNESGYTEHKCTVCGYESYKTDYKPYLGHDIKTSTVKPTCTDMGYTLHKCSRCDYSYKDNYVSSLKHDYKAVKTVAHTCTEDGYTLMTCTRCKDSYKDHIFHAPGHSYTAKVIAPTCKDKGYTEKKCSVCGNVVKENYKDIDKSKHKYVKTKTVPPTCKDNGYTEYKCSVCGDVKKDDHTDADAKLHKYTSNVVAPTCTAQGYTEYTCTVCGDSYKGNYRNAAGHHFDEGTVTKEPTYEAKGEKTFTCKDCGKTYTAALPQLIRPEGSSLSDDSRTTSKPDESSTAGDSSSSSKPEESSAVGDSSSSSKPDDSQPEVRPQPIAAGTAKVSEDGKSITVSPEKDTDGSITSAYADITTFSDISDETAAACTKLVISEGVTALDLDAVMKKFPALTEIKLPKTVEEIYTVSADTSKVRFTCIENSFADIFAKSNGIKSTYTEADPEYIKGDANGDNEINVTDIAMIAAHIKGIKPLVDVRFIASDVNGDGMLNVTDIALIASHIKGIKAIV